MSKLRIEDFILQNKDAFDIIEPAPIAANAAAIIKILK